MLDFYENRVDESLVYLQEAVYHNPSEPDYWFALGQVSARAEHYSDAAEAYNRFLTVTRSTDSDRRVRIKGLIEFLRYIGQREAGRMGSYHCITGRIAGAADSDADVQRHGDAGTGPHIAGMPR